MKKDSEVRDPKVLLETAAEISVKLKSLLTQALSHFTVYSRLRNGAFRSLPPSEPSFCLHMGGPDVREITQTFAAVMGGGWVEPMKFPGFDLTHQNTFDLYCQLRVYYLQLPPQSPEFATSC